jgi:hypothetical protein
MLMKKRLLFLLVFTIIHFVKINAQCTISTSTNASALTCGTAPLSSCGGILYIGNGTTAMTLTMDAALNLTCLGPIQLIVRNNATLTFTPGNDYLTLATGSSLIFQPGSNLTGGSCNASERIYIGTDLIASCNGGGPGADYTFTQLLSNGGYNIVSGSFSPVSLCGSGTFTGTATPIPSAGATIKWYTVASGGSPVFTGNPYTTPTISTTTTYYVEAFYSSSSFTTPRVAVTATVNPLPATPTIGTITQPTCTLSTGSLVLSNLPSGSWTLTRGGDSSATTTGSGTSTTISGLEAGNYNFNVSNGTCTSLVSANVSITASNSTTWNGTTWSSGLPTLTRAVIINGNYTTGTNGSFSACSVTINSPAVINVSPNTYLEIQNDLTNNGTINVLNNGSLIQVSNAAVNTGNVNVYRDTNVKLYDYVYWSSPVNSFNVANISPSSIYKYKWSPTAANANGGEGNWLSASGTMNNAEGYIVRTPSIAPFNTSTVNTLTATFTGIPNNGIYTPTIYRGNDYTTPGTLGTPRAATDDNWNLLGNPYPSAIGVNEFLSANLGVIQGFVNIWTHGNLPTSTVNPFYQNYTSNYYASDYITVNRTGATSGAGDYKIGSGQGFFVLMNPGPAGSASVTFNNSMRSAGFANNQFYRMSSNKNSNVVGKSRIWLDLVSSSQTNRILVGYIEGATNDNDQMFDAFTDNKNSQNFYSLINDEKMIIQGKSLPFEESDEVSLGIKVAANGNYTIAIAAVDGLFDNNNQNVYLEDKLQNYIHNLTSSPYEFTSSQGIVNNRFVLKYNNRIQDDKNAQYLDKIINIVTSENEFTITSENENIKEFSVHDLLGRALFSKKDINQNATIVNQIEKNNQVLTVKIILSDNQAVVKKIIY